MHIYFVLYIIEQKFAICVQKMTPVAIKILHIAATTTKKSSKNIILDKEMLNALMFDKHEDQIFLFWFTI